MGGGFSDDIMKTVQQPVPNAIEIVEALPPPIVSIASYEAGYYRTFYTICRHECIIMAERTRLSLANAMNRHIPYHRDECDVLSAIV